MSEEFVIRFRHWLSHQAELHNVRIQVRYEYVSGLEKYPDFRALRSDAKSLLDTNAGDNKYWEKLNRSMALGLLAAYPTLTKVTSEIGVPPSPNKPFWRKSVATLTRADLRAA